MQRAFYLARPKSRPVMVSAPFDVQLEEFDGRQPYVPRPSCSAPPLLPHPERIQQACAIIGASERS